MNTFCTAAAYIGLNMCESTEKPIENTIEQAFVQHLAAYGVSYGTKEEFAFRMDIFA